MSNRFPPPIHGLPSSRFSPQEAALLHALAADPTEAVGWNALADCLEENGDPLRAELLRLRLRLANMPYNHRRRPHDEARLRDLLLAGVSPLQPGLVVAIAPDVFMEFVLIPPGSFLHGSPDEEPDREDHEGPRHLESIDDPFYLAIHPVTQAQWQAVLAHNPSHFSPTGAGASWVAGLDTRDFPVEQIDHNQAETFVEELSRIGDAGKAGWLFRLPTEVEWEYACRAGRCSSRPFSLGDTLASTHANFNGRRPYGDAPLGPSLERTTRVGSYLPNAWGLHDLHGNVYEWCAGWWDGHNDFRSRVARGGCWWSPGHQCRSAHRSRFDPETSEDHLGLRVALFPPRRPSRR